jgi:hypothetical protein
LSLLLPRQADNSYRGSRIALGIFAVLVLMRVVMSVNSIVNGRLVASTADGIPLDAYTPAGARTVLSLFALLALSNLMIALVGIVVLVRYRGLVPFMFALFLLHHLARRLILEVMPIERVGAPPGSAINLGLLGLTVVGLALSLWPRGRPPALDG